MAYPSILSVISNPQASDRLNSPSHSSIHQAENTAITEIETFVGTLSSTAGSLVYDIRSPLSNGGGHVQTANKGGTGQTTYTKGDLLVASSGSVLTKLAIAGDNQVLTASSVTATGVTWSAPQGSKVFTTGTPVSVIATATETSLLSAPVLASTIGTSGALRMTLNIPFVNVPNGDVLTLKSFMAGSSVANFVISANGVRSSYFGRMETDVISKGVVSSQMAFTTLSLLRGGITDVSIPSVLAQQSQALNISFDSGATQTIGVTATFQNGAAGERIDTAGGMVERIT